MLTIKMQNHLCPMCEHKLTDQLKCPECGYDLQMNMNGYSQKRKAIRETNEHIKFIESVMKGNALDHV